MKKPTKRPTTARAKLTPTSKFVEEMATGQIYKQINIVEQRNDIIFPSKEALVLTQDDPKAAEGRAILERMGVMFGKDTLSRFYSIAYFEVSESRAVYILPGIPVNSREYFDSLIELARLDLEGGIEHPSIEGVQNWIELEWHKMPVSFRPLTRKNGRIRRPLKINPKGKASNNTPKY